MSHIYNILGTAAICLVTMAIVARSTTLQGMIAPAPAAK